MFKCLCIAFFHKDRRSYLNGKPGGIRASVFNGRAMRGAHMGLKG
jgi:hypothetical protein